MLSSRSLKRSVCMVAAVLLAFSVPDLQAAPIDTNVLLDIQAADGVWQVFGQIEDASTNAGIFGLQIDVWGTGGADVTGSKLELPRGVSGVNYQPFGFNVFPQDGVNGIGIGGGQNNITGVNVLIGIGLTAGESDADLSQEGAPDVWDVPVLLASGTYSGSTGELHVAMPDDSQFNLLPHGYTGGQTHGLQPLVLGDSAPLDGDDIVAAAGGPYEEDDWPMTPHGWNNPARTIALSGTGSTGVIDAYDWFIAPPVSGDFMPLVAAGPTPDVSIQAIADALGITVDDLPGPYGPGGPDPTIYEYRLMLTVSGGGASDSDETTLFVPEPGTVILLGLGGLAALIRRRRS